MPDIYTKGEPHRPVTTVTGHFVGMQPAGPLFGAKPDKIWYRGDDYAALTIRLAEIEIMVRSLEVQIKDLSGRRPPRRATR